MPGDTCEIVVKATRAPVARIESLKTAVEGLQRPAWVPVVSSGDGPPACSKFSGIPFLQEGEAWPVCTNCGRPMQLFLQLDLAGIPLEMQAATGFGILQLFYCVNRDPFCEVDCHAADAFSASVMARIVQPNTTSHDHGVILPELDGYFLAKRIIDWERVADYPGLEDLERRGIEFDGDSIKTILAIMQENKWPSPNPGDKLGGWPFWIQSPVYPECTTCGKEMHLVFQIASENNLPYMFGDDGIGQLFQCDDHNGVLAFHRNCY
ncbi:MAG: DUF1963 domain-containing protein [Candidatus Sigynarchaeota archaeon]